MTRVVHSRVDLTLDAGQHVIIDEIYTTVAGTYVTLFYPNALSDADPPPAASETPPLHRAVTKPDVAAEAPSPDPVESAKTLLAAAGLTSPGPTAFSGRETPPPGGGAPPGGGTIADLLAEVRQAGKYLTLVKRAKDELGIRDVNGHLTEREEPMLRSLCRAILGRE